MLGGFVDKYKLPLISSYTSINLTDPAQRSATIAAAVAVLTAVLAGLLLHRLAIAPAGAASPVVLIIVTIGASLVLRGLASIAFGKQLHSLPGFSGSEPIQVGGASIVPQALWVMAGVVVIVAACWLFLEHTLTGKALRATAANRLAAMLVGIDTGSVVALSFALSAAIGAVAGVLVTPIALTSYDAGIMLALKGFAAVVLGGLGNPAGAIAGGLVLGLVEAYSAGYLSSTYKDAVAFIVLIAVLLAMPGGLLGARTVERV